MDTKAPNPAQARFDQMYISSTEITTELGVSRVAVLQARRRGLLPEPVVVNQTQIYLWERATVKPFLDAWRINLASRRGELRC